MNNISIIFFILWTTISCSVSSTWSSSINGMFTARNLIPRTTGMTTDIVESIANGAQLAINHCKNIFKWDKWNCPESAFSRRLKHPSNREQALTHAIVSAGLVHTITRNCSRGQLQGCGCNQDLRGPLPLKERYLLKRNVKIGEDSKSSETINWSWGGCSDDVEFGQLMAKVVLDELERGNDPQAVINLHNNLVGRQIVQSTMSKKCKCHGISGSCSLQTCWMQVASFSRISNILKQRYKKALKIDLENKSNRIFGMDSLTSSNSDQMLPHITSKQLVFMEYSPDYCIANSTTDWPGTKGRMCSRSKLETTSLAEKRSCKNVCRTCGRRVRKHKRQISMKCNCVFKWCCEVQCSTCTEMVEEYFCD